MSKSKGSRTERELIHLFYEAGWGSCRMAGSGSTTLPSPDIIAGKPGRFLAIECKSGKNTHIRYIKEEQIKELNEFSSRFGAESFLAVRFDREGWYFLKPEQLMRTKSGVYAVSLKLAQEKGLSFDSLIR